MIASKPLRPAETDRLLSAECGAIVIVGSHHGLLALPKTYPEKFHFFFQRFGLWRFQSPSTA
jgi:hypothetical protein